MYRISVQALPHCFIWAVPDKASFQEAMEPHCVFIFPLLLSLRVHHGISPQTIMVAAVACHRYSPGLHKHRKYNGCILAHPDLRIHILKVAPEQVSFEELIPCIRLYPHAKKIITAYHIAKKPLPIFFITINAALHIVSTICALTAGLFHITMYYHICIKFNSLFVQQLIHRAFYPVITVHKSDPFTAGHLYSPSSG